jgi:uncharacterized protein (TIGR02246 family)
MILKIARDLFGGKKILKQIFMISAFIMTLGAVGFGQAGAAKDEQKIRDLIGKWDAAYRAMDGNAMAALETTDFELIDRFGDWHPQTSREENARMWNWTFKNIYQGKPGPRHTIEHIRFVGAETAIVICKAFWAEPITLPDGSIIPPHGQTTTFTVVKNKKDWQIAAQTVHNVMDSGVPATKTPREQLPWNN